jgi:hypothetical protein
MKRLVLAFALAACSGTSKPVVTPGQVVVACDTTFRTHENNAIEVSVVRKHGGKEATGVATLHDMALDAAQKSPLVGVAAGRAWLSLENALASEPAAAYEAARKGIDELGTAYRTKRDGKHVTDDTGSTLKLAEMSAAQGDLARAAEQTADVLESRIETYLRVFKGSVE